MSKKLISRVARKQDDNWMHCCKYCHSFENGRCWNSVIYAQMVYNNVRVYEVQEGGHSAQAINEVLGDEKLMRKFMFNLMDVFADWKVSDKRRRDFIKHFSECWENFSMDLSDELDTAVGIVYQNRLDFENTVEIEGILIDNPTEYCCKEWS